MTIYEELQIEVATALAFFVRIANDLTPLSIKKIMEESLLKASACAHDDLADLPNAIKRTLRCLRDIERETSGSCENINTLISKTAELGSILRIGRAYPENALKRARAVHAFYKAPQAA